MSSLRDQIDDAMHGYMCPDCQLPQAFDAVMKPVEAALDAKDAKIERLTRNLAESDEDLNDALNHNDDTCEAVKGRDQAEAERDRLRDLLTEILTHFHEHGHPGRPTIRTCWIDADTVTGWRHAAALDQPEPKPEACARCHGLGKVPDWSNWDDYHGEPKPKPCPDCTPDEPAKEGQ